MNFLDFEDFLYSYGRKKNISEIYVYYSKTQEQSMSCLKGKIKNYSINLSDICSVCLTVNGKTVSLSTNSFTKSEAVRIVNTAIEMCKFLQPSSQFLSHNNKKVEIQQKSSLSTYKEISKLILNAEFEALNYSKKISSISTCSFKENITEISITNSKGLNKKREFTNKFLYVSPVSNIKNRTYNGFYYSFGKTISDIDYKKTARKSSKNTIKHIDPKPIVSGNYNVIFRNNAFCDLLNTFSSVFSAESCYKGTSLLQNKMHCKIASNIVKIVDCGLKTQNGLCCKFDDDGTDTKTKLVIENGKLNTLLYNNEWAKKLNTKSTGNGFKEVVSLPSKICPCVFYLCNGTTTKKQLLNAYNSVILITELNGLHSGANINTGDFSLEATGFFVSGGKIMYPIENFTICDNFYDILKKIELIGNDLYFDIPTLNSQYGSPSTLVSNVSISNS